MKILGNQKFNTYTNYIEHLQDKGYIKENFYLDEKSEIVTKYSLAKGATGTVIDIRCPSRYKISLEGKNQLSENDKTENAHTLIVRLIDDKGEEISPDTRIRIIKEKCSEEITQIANMLYKDITTTEYMKIPPNGIKSPEDFYRFDNGIEMNGEDHLKINAINSDRNIDAKNVKLGLSIDLWELE